MDREYITFECFFLGLIGEGMHNALIFFVLLVMVVAPCAMTGGVGVEMDQRK